MRHWCVATFITEGDAKFQVELGENKGICGSSLATQWLGLCAFTAEGLGSIPGQGTTIPQASRPKIKKERHLCSHHESRILGYEALLQVELTAADPGPPLLGDGAQRPQLRAPQEDPVPLLPSQPRGPPGAVWVSAGPHCAGQR